MSWSSRRRTFYFFGFVVLIAAGIGLPTYLFFHKAPTCTDGIQNGTEEGIDCGGSCAIICSFSAATPIVKWQRSFEVVPGIYTAVAFVENPNSNVGANNLSYAFKLRAADNVLVAEPRGTFNLPPKTTVPVFVTGIQTGSRIPTRTEFLLGTPTWTYVVPPVYKLSVLNRQLTNESTEPRVTADLKNNEVNPVKNLPVIVVVYDVDGNALQASRTVIDSIPSLGTVPLIFTWPRPFTAPVNKIEILPIPGVDTTH